MAGGESAARLAWYGCLVCLLTPAVCLPAETPTRGSLVSAAKSPGPAAAPVLGSCFLVDEKKGYFVASFSTLHEVAAANIHLDGGAVLPVRGFVAASRGKDIVILNTGRVAGGKPWTLAPQAPVKEGDELVPWSGALSKSDPFPTVPPAFVCLPRLARTTRGDVLTLMVPPEAPHVAGSDADADWILLDQPRDPDAAGAPVVTPQGDVVGMYSGSITVDGKLFAAIHARHIEEVLQGASDKSRPLSTLNSWSDRVTEAGTLPPKFPSDDLSGRFHRGEDLSTRFDAYQTRSMVVEAAETRLGRDLKGHASQLVKLVADQARVEAALRGMAPELTRRIQERREEFVRNERGEYVRQIVTETRLVPEFSRRQLDERRRLAGEGTRVTIELTKARVLDGYAREVERPAFAVLRRRFDAEWIFLLDPFGLHGPKQHAQLLDDLTDQITDGGAPALVYAARAFLHARNLELAECLDDLEEAEDIDDTLVPILRAIEAYARHAKGQAKEAARLFVTATDPSSPDSRVLVLQAATKYEAKAYAECLKLLEEARLAGADPVEVDLVSAWIYAADAKLFKKKPRAGFAHAERAVSCTGRCDWFSLAALAACHARQGDYDRAAELIEMASTVAPSYAYSRCEAWRQALDSKQPLSVTP